jgi:hypothetical protein
VIVARQAGSVPVPEASRSTPTAAGPRIPSWSQVWLAPVPTRFAGRSAVSSSSGIPEARASMAAGTRFPTAVPEVVATATTLPEAFAIPRAVNAATRSSILTCSRSSPAVSAA